MKRILLAAGLAVLAMSPAVQAEQSGYFSVWEPTTPGIAWAFGGLLRRTGGSNEPLRDYTVGAQFVAQNGPGIHQWAFGLASEAWALPGSRSILVALESAVINQEPANDYPKIANNAVMKNRADGGADPGQPMNANSIAYWVTAQPGTGFERGLVFDRSSILANRGRAAAIDLSDIPDDQIGQIDLIRIRKDVSVRFDPASRQLVLHVTPAAP